MSSAKEITASRRKIVSWIVLFISTIFIQYANNRVDEFQYQLYLDILTASNNIEIGTAYGLAGETSIFKQFLPYESLPANVLEDIKNEAYESMDDLVSQDPKIKNVIDKLRSGEIEIRQYFREIANIQTKKSKENFNLYNSRIEQIKKKLREGTSWKLVINLLLIFQTLCLIYIGYGYLDDIRNISKNISIAKTKSLKAKKTK